MSYSERGRDRLRLLGGGLAALAVFWSCDGQNLFAPEALLRDALPPRVEIVEPREPAARPIGDSVLVTARITDDTGVDSVFFGGVAFRGDARLGTDEVVQRYISKVVRFPAPVRDTLLSRYLLATADETRETAVLFVMAWDSPGNLAADSIQMIVGGPRVQFLTIQDNQQIQAGLSLNLQVEASDPEGILDLLIEIRGVFERTLESSFPAAPDTVRVDTAVVLPAGVTGDIEVTATARNSLGVPGQDGPVPLRIVSADVLDRTPPRVAVTTVSTDRLELSDLITVNVSGADDVQGSGVQRVGYTVRAISPTRGDTLVRTEERTFTPPRTGNLTASFAFFPFNVDELSLPDTLIYEVTGWMYDRDGNCGASVSATLESLACGTLPGGEVVAQGRTGTRLTRVMVAGRTVQLPRGGTIMDAAVDTIRENLLLSNIDRNRIEVFRLQSLEFGEAIGVGSQPWGVSLDRSGDRLLVANSGGINVSVVDLGQERELEGERIFIPDVVIFDVELKIGDSGVSLTFYPFPTPQSPSFADRPQFLAVDVFGNLIYSTRTTLLGDVGTVRKGYQVPGAPFPEAKLFVEHGALTPAEDFWAVAHIDSIVPGSATVTQVVGTDTITRQVDALVFYDHLPGFPSSVVSASANPLTQFAVANAVDSLRVQGSDAFLAPGFRWNIPSFGFSDLTYVSASGDGRWVLIGEGATAPTGRVLLHQAVEGPSTPVSPPLRVWDEIINVADVVRGIGLNYDGTLGMARGQTAYFFDTELQLNGLVALAGAGQGAGAALHPLHANQRTLQNLSGAYRPDTHLAFIGTGARTIDIVDTFKFLRVGQVALRDMVNGPLRAVLPFPEDNAGLTCATIPVTDRYGGYVGDAVQLYQGGEFTQPLGSTGVTDDRCVVVKLFGTTTAGGVVVVPVRKSDILKEHPNR